MTIFQAEEALRESEERYRRIVETTSEGICTTDALGRVTVANRPFAEMLGLTLDELEGQLLLDVLPEASRTTVAERLERAGSVEESEVDVVRPDGSRFCALLRTRPIVDADGTFVGTLTMVTDHTQHNQDVEALRASEAQYRQIVESTTDGIVKIDLEARIVFVNRRFAAMLGYEVHEMLGSSIADFVHAKTRANACEALAAWATAPIDPTFQHRDGTEITVNLAGAKMVDGDGRQVGSLAIVRDVTERKKLQSQLLVSDRMASVGTLAAGVAHEINNPMAAVLANLDYMAELIGTAPGGTSAQGEAWLREELRSPLADAREAAQRVRFIVRDLKLFSRSPTEEPRGPIDVRSILESSLRMAGNELRHRARLVESYGVVPLVEANGARLGQVFLNLVMNAAQSLPDGDAEANEIRIETRFDEGRVLVEVSDTGPGIPAELLDGIFDAFFTTKAVGSGTGLGLAICQRIVTDLGGTLTVASALGTGTTFQVSLPAAHLEEERANEAPVVPVAATGRRGRILVVDDEDLVLRSVKRVLGREHDVVTVASAQEALARCAAGETFDLILSDLMMPAMTGSELHRELVRVAPAQAERMIFLTGGAFTEQGRRFLSDPPREHLEKPFEAANLRAIARRFVG